MKAKNEKSEIFLIFQQNIFVILLSLNLSY